MAGSSSSGASAAGLLGGGGGGGGSAGVPHSSAVLKATSLIKHLKKLNENDYESDQSLEYLKRLDSTFSEEKPSRQDIAKAMIEYNYPGCFFASYFFLDLETYFFMYFFLLDLALKYLKYYTKRTFLENEQTWPCTFYLLRSIWNYSDISSEIAIVN